MGKNLPSFRICINFFLLYISEEFEFTNLEIKKDNLLHTFDCWGMEFMISFDTNIKQISNPGKISSILYILGAVYRQT